MTICSLGQALLGGGWVGKTHPSPRRACPRLDHMYINFWQLGFSHYWTENLKYVLIHQQNIRAENGKSEKHQGD